MKSFAIFMNSLWNFFKESLRLAREMNNAPRVEMGDLIIAPDGTNYLVEDIKQTEERTLIIFKAQGERNMVIGGHKYAVELDDTLSPEEYHFTKAAKRSRYE